MDLLPDIGKAKYSESVPGGAGDRLGAAAWHKAARILACYL